MYLKERVVENRVIGHPGQGIYKLVLSGQIAKEAKPGQFVHIQVSDSHDPLLRRPLSIAGIDPAKEEITIYYRVVGQGTDLLTRVQINEYISAMGPLGTGFTVPRSGELLLIAGGIGVFPLFSLIQAVDTEKVAVKLLWGGENKGFLESADLAQLLSMEIDVEVTTLDGSYGEQGFVTKLLEAYPSSVENTLRAASCGPKGMLRAVAEICDRKGIPLEVSLEEHMACGVGACLGCVCTVKKDDGSLARKRVCKEGPVLDSREVVWMSKEVLGNNRSNGINRGDQKSTQVTMSVTLGPLTLKNPVVTSSGTYGFGEEYAPYCDPSLLGGITVKGITPLPRLGNPVPRLAETPAGLLNSVGLENPGLDEFIKSYIPKLIKLNTAIIVNISGFSVEDYAQMASALQRKNFSQHSSVALEVNISCPNIKHGGMAFGTNPKSAEEVIAVVRENTDLPIIAKLSPNVTDIGEMAKAVESGGADIISLINTLLGMRINIHSQKPVLANKMGGLSGPAVRPVAVRMVYQVYEAVKLPIIGMGGISSWEDAIEFMLAGASAVSVGTANFVNPYAPIDIMEGIEAYCQQKGYRHVSQLVGLAHSD